MSLTDMGLRRRFSINLVSLSLVCAKMNEACREVQAYHVGNDRQRNRMRDFVMEDAKEDRDRKRARARVRELIDG